MTTLYTQNLKTAEELENEDREAQSAKLQELIRRGTPRDLAQAQELMKSLAGANPDAKPDYRTQAFNEIHKLESQIILLIEMLDNAVPGERSVQGDAYDVSLQVPVSPQLLTLFRYYSKWLLFSVMLGQRSKAGYLMRSHSILRSSVGEISGLNSGCPISRDVSRHLPEAQ